MVTFDDNNITFDDNNIIFDDNNIILMIIISIFWRKIYVFLYL